MNAWQIAGGILLFALVTAVLYAWGLAKSADQEDTLHRNLMHRSRQRLITILQRVMIRLLWQWRCL